MAANLAERRTTARERPRERAQEGHAFVGIDSGLQCINEFLNGLMPDEVTTLAADTSIGKTALACEIALNVMKAGNPVGFFPLEMTKEQLFQNFTRLHGNLEPEDYRKGRLSGTEVDQLQKARAELRTMPITVYDRGPYTLDRIRAAMMHREQVQHVDLWVIDYLQRIRMDRGDKTELSRLTAEIRTLSQQLHTHILLLSQFSWRTRDRPDRRPQIGDMKGSSSIEQDSVNVVLLYRPGFYDAVRQGTRKSDLPALNRSAELIFAKTRQGPTGERPITWVPERGYYTDFTDFVAIEEQGRARLSR
jgi:replicative DNA helicase